jgi:hypothetical protein
VRRPSGPSWWSPCRGRTTRQDRWASPRTPPASVFTPSPSRTTTLTVRCRAIPSSSATLASTSSTAWAATTSSRWLAPTASRSGWPRR